MSISILIGDCCARMAELPDNSVDSVVCDPPYHLTSIVKRFGSENAAPAKVGQTGAYARASKGFMGQTWDGGDVAFQPETWAEVLRVLKPGGHLIAFSGTRTYHRMAVAIEDAGFEIRDQLAWAYGSGFPKSHDISKQIDKAAGAERNKKRFDASQVGNFKARQDSRPWIEEAKAKGYHEVDGDEPATDAAREWWGWGTALKPAWEPICLARKPISEKNIAANVLKWGTGALNIDGCRIETADDTARKNNVAYGLMHEGRSKQGGKPFEGGGHEQGRWPANLCHDGSDEVLAGFPDDTGANGGSGSFAQHAWMGGETPQEIERSKGSAARFFYCAKAATDERGEGNNHPTVKPVALMRWLVRMVTPKGGTVLDPFMGSGSTGLAADAEQMNFIGCEMSPEYAAIAERRMRDAAGMFADVKVAA